MLYIILLFLEIFLLYLLKRKVMSRLFNFLGLVPFAILFLPGTFIHEMSHFLVALFLLVPIGQIELLPHRDGNEIKMGSVPIGKTDPIRRTLIGIAPVILGLIITLTIIYFTLKNNWVQSPTILTLVLYVLFVTSNSMFSSKEDLKGVLPVFVISIIIYAVLYYLGVRVSVPINEEIFKSADLFLLVPIGIDLVLSI